MSVEPRGTLAQRPAADADSRNDLYFATDGGSAGTGGLYQSNGAAWILLSDLGAYVPTGAAPGLWLLDAMAGADDDAKMAAALAAWAASTKGGTIVLAARAHSFANAWQPKVASFDGARFDQMFLRITGSGAGHNGSWSAPIGGTVCDMTYNGAAPAKIDTRGNGTIEIDHLIFTDSSGSTKPFFQTTNTTPKIHDCAFQGSKGAAWDQDAIILGGTGTTEDGTSNAPFQGYGGFIRDNYFDALRRGVYGRTYCNGMPITNNAFSSRCGADSSAAAIEFLGIVANTCAGNMVRDNVIEGTGYVYGLKCDYATNNVFGPNGFYDVTGTFTACYRFGDNGTYNLVIDGFRPDTKALVSETAAATNKNTVITAHQSQSSVFAQPVTFKNTITVGPGAVSFSGQTSGQNQLSGLDGSAVEQGAFSNFLRTWKATGAGGVGGDLIIDSGTGGSFVYVNAFRIRFRDQSGNRKIALCSGLPLDASLNASEVGMYFDDTNGAAKVNFKGKTANGTVVTGQLALA